MQYSRVVPLFFVTRDSDLILRFHDFYSACLYNYVYLSVLFCHCSVKNDNSVRLNRSRVSLSSSTPGDGWCTSEKAWKRETVMPVTLSGENTWIVSLDDFVPLLARMCHHVSDTHSVPGKQRLRTDAPVQRWNKHVVGSLQHHHLASEKVEVIHRLNQPCIQQNAKWHTLTLKAGIFKFNQNNQKRFGKVCV